MGRKQRVKLLQFVDALVAHATQAMTSGLGAADAEAKVVANDIARRICSQYGRSYMYVPAAMYFELNDRDREIWRKYGEIGPGETGARPFTRARVDELAEEHGITPQQIYNITRLTHQLDMKDRQPGLPGIEA